MENFIKFLHDRYIFDDPEDILQAVGEYLEYKAEETLREEPYATTSAQRYRDAAMEVFRIQYDD